MPGKGFLVREHHRTLLTVHALVMISGLLTCAVLNRRFSPDRFWVQWVALGWGIAFVVVKILTGVFDPPPQHLSFPWGYLALVTGVVVACVVAVAAGAVRATRRPSVDIIRDL